MKLLLTAASFFLSILPSFLLCWYVYRKDAVEKEPFRVLALLFAAGAAAYVPCRFAEPFLCDLIDRAFSQCRSVNVLGVTTFANAGAELCHHILSAFLAIALLEETVRLVVLHFLTRKEPEFNYCFDGIVYSVFVALGFAAAKSVGYALTDGWDVLLLRAAAIAPSCFLYGVVSGVFYSRSRVYALAGEKEKELLRMGTVEKRRVAGRVRLYLPVLLAPALLHGLYELSELYVAPTLRFLAAIASLILLVICFLFVRRISKRDEPISAAAHRILSVKHGELPGGDEPE